MNLEKLGSISNDRVIVQPRVLHVGRTKRENNHLSDDSKLIVELDGSFLSLELELNRWDNFLAFAKI